MPKRKAKRMRRDPVHSHVPEIVGTATVGERGQVVIPADVRRKLRLRAGERLLVLVKDGMLGFVKVEAMRTLMKHMNRELGKLS